ncbi:MAG: right-handed parallel beta-helix repeat-containing protein [Actinomycetota bacterium]|nr:right-handed parallel beta-helix repeat-containing protein [Actinomycetota bacterium]
MATYYVDGAAGSDLNAGTSFGAAFATIGKAASVIANGDKVLICATATYTLTATVTWNTVGTAALGGVVVSGADASGNELNSGTGPTITSATNSVALFSLNGAAFFRFKYLKLTHTAATRGDGFACVTTAPSSITLEGVTIDGCLNGWNAGSRDAANLVISDCLIQNCTAVGIVNGAANAQVLRDSVIYNCTSHGLSTNGNACSWTISRSVIAKNGGKGLYDVGTARTVTFLVESSDIVDNTSDGIRSDESTGSFTLQGSLNIIWGNGGYGVNISAQAATNSDARRLWHHNFYGSNTSGNNNGTSAGSGDVTGLSDPFVSRAGQNWALNNTANAGASVRAAGYPSAYRGVSTNNYLDGGAAQHQDSGGGGLLVHPGMRGGMRA